MSGLASSGQRRYPDKFLPRWPRLQDGIDGAALLTSFSSYKPGAEGKPDGLGVILQRAVHVAFGAARNAPVVERGGMVRLEPDGIGEILHRAVRVAFGAARNAPVVEGGGMVRLEPDGLGESCTAPSGSPLARRAMPRLLRAAACFSPRRLQPSVL
jgi:hypothetical protein